MDNFVFSLNATIPIFLVMVLGYILMRVKFFTEDFVSVVNKYVFKVALPVLLFRDIATTPVSEVFDIRFVVFCIIANILFQGTHLHWNHIVAFFLIICAVYLVFMK